MTPLFLALFLQPVTALSQAHSHNDYEQKEPLELAMAQGFGSVEADIYLVDGALLVAHDRQNCDPNRTLEALYLRPLWQRYLDGRHVPDILLVDIKTDGAKAWRVLRAELERYRPMLASPRRQGIRVVISGDRPRDLIFGDDLTAYDGRPEDFDAPASWSLPLISTSWTSHFRWNGSGSFPANEQNRLREMVGQAHAKNRKIRFWATADTPSMWTVLRDAGVDLIGTDQPKALADFLRS